MDEHNQFIYSNLKNKNIIVTNDDIIPMELEENSIVISYYAFISLFASLRDLLDNEETQLYLDIRGLTYDIYDVVINYESNVTYYILTDASVENPQLFTIGNVLVYNKSKYRNQIEEQLINGVSQKKSDTDLIANAKNMIPFNRPVLFDSINNNIIANNSNFIIYGESNRYKDKAVKYIIKQFKDLGFNVTKYSTNLPIKELANALVNIRMNTLTKLSAMAKNDCTNITQLEELQVIDCTPELIVIDNIDEYLNSFETDHINTILSVISTLVTIGRAVNVYVMFVVEDNEYVYANLEKERNEFTAIHIGKMNKYDLFIEFNYDDSISTITDENAVIVSSKNNPLSIHKINDLCIKPKDDPSLYVYM